MSEPPAIVEAQICAYGADGLRRILKTEMPQVDGLCWYVSCQDPDGEVTADLARQIRSRGAELGIHRDRGLSNNRNHGLARDRAPYALICDDDLSYDADGLRAMIETVRSHSDIDIFAFRFRAGCPRVYPPAEHDLGRPFKGYSVCSVELCFRTGALRSRGLRFSPLAGIGSPRLAAAEESILVANCLKRGLRGRFFPIEIASHDAPTTYDRLLATAPFVRSTGAYIAVAFGTAEGLLRCLLCGLRTPASKPKAIIWALQGFIYAKRHKL